VVWLSTIHRAKGDEAERVYILRPDLLPHPRARTPQQQEQEQNLRYVAFTRAKEALSFVGGPAPRG
jgi:superfamily I DNA/RNA helicase